MSRIIQLATLFLMAFALPALTACADPKPLFVDQAWVRLSPSKDIPSAVYFTIHGGPQPVKLVSVLTEAALRVEMHETVTTNGVASMRPIKDVDVPAGETVTFGPNGKHLMVWGINPAVAATGKVEFTMIFTNGDRLIVDAAVRKMGATEGAAANDKMGGEKMGGEKMGGMDHANMSMPADNAH